jgi:hypothetical protein
MFLRRSVDSFSLRDLDENIIQATCPMSAIRAYQAALRDYNGEREQAAEMFKLITTTAESISYRQVALLAHFFGVPAPADQANHVRNEAHKHRYDLSKWPSYEDMVATIQSWHVSFSLLNEAWHQIPQDERLGLQPPPKVMQTTTP